LLLPKTGAIIGVSKPHEREGYIYNDTDERYGQDKDVDSVFL
jgi:hypothetical protein